MTSSSLTSSTSGSYTSNQNGLPPLPPPLNAGFITRASSAPTSVFPFPTLPATPSRLVAQIQPISRASSDPLANRLGMGSTARRISQITPFDQDSVFGRSTILTNPNDRSHEITSPDDAALYFATQIDRLSRPPESFEIPSDTVTLPPELDADLMSRLASSRAILTSQGPRPQALPFSQSLNYSSTPMPLAPQSASLQTPQLLTDDELEQLMRQLAITRDQINIDTQSPHGDPDTQGQI